MGLTAAEIVDYLADEDQLGPPERSPWPEYEPDQGDLYLVDWRGLFGGFRGEPIVQSLDDPQLAADVNEVIGTGPPTETEAVEAARARRPEICAWYQPIHFHGMAWGIFVSEPCLRSIAVDISRFINPVTYSSVWPYLPELLRMSFASLFLHEAYHHKTEALAIRLHVSERVPRYRDYWTKVYEPLAKASGSGPLEEALANADSYLRLSERAYRRFVSKEVFEATRSYLRWRFPLDPPGYRDAGKYLQRATFDDGQNLLRCQVQEATTAPFRTAAHWRLAPNMNESLFGITSDIWMVVPPGSMPTIPTFPLYRPVATRPLESALRSKYGYARVKGGKGSHIRLKAQGKPPLTFPVRKDLPPHVLKNTAVALGFTDTGTLLAALGL